MMTGLRRFWSWHAMSLLMILLLLIIAPTFAQEIPPARGPVIEGNPRGADTGSLNPLFCDNAACRRLTSLLYPTLMSFENTEQYNGRFIPNLAASWLASDKADGLTYTFELAKRTWSDGTPITAYDVFFSYLIATYKDSVSPYKASLEGVVTAVAPVSETGIIFYLEDDLLYQLNFPIIPAHVYDPAFAEDAARVFGSDADPLEAYQTWLTTYPPEERHRQNVRFHAESVQPTVTAGAFRFEPGRDNEARAFRLYAADPTIIPEAYVLVDTHSPDDTVDRFINGEINFIANPPVDRRADLRAVPGVQIAQFEGNTYDYIGLNLANPNRPRSRDNSEPPGDHPLFADPDVRQALRLALDIESLIDSVVQGDGHGNTSGYRENLTEAKRLLEAANWKDANGDGIRECVDCRYARDGDPLRFTLLLDNSNPRFSDNGRVIADQLAAAGFLVSLDTFSAQNLPQIQQEQRFDAYMTTFTMTLPGVDDEATFVYDLEHETSMNGFPVVWLYVPDEFYVAAPGVQNFAPKPGLPLWNMTAWAIAK